MHTLRTLGLIFRPSHLYKQIRSQRDFVELCMTAMLYPKFSVVVDAEVKQHSIDDSCIPMMSNIFSLDSLTAIFTIRAF